MRYCVEVLRYDPNSTNKQGKNALQLAAQVGQSTIVCYLNEFVMENSIYSSIHLAALNGHYDVVQTLVTQHQVDPLWCIDQGLNPLQCSCVNGDERIVEFLIKEASNSQPITDFIAVTTSSGDTLLHFAALSGSVELTEYLINKFDIRPDITNDRGVTPFHIAVYAGNERLVSFCMYYKHMNAKSLLVESTGQNALHIAAIKCHTHLLKDLINFEIDPTAKDMLGCTSFHYVALSGNLEIFQLLMNSVKEIDFIEVVDNEQHTILHYAVRSGSLDLVKFILSHQEKVIHCIDNKQWTALHHAADTTGAKSPQIFSQRKKELCFNVTVENQLKIVRFLVEEMNCNPTSRIVGGYKLSHHPDNLEIVKYLIEELHLNPNSCDDDGRNTLHHACMTGKLDIVQYLLNEHGCDLTCLDNNGNSVVHYACWGGDVNLLKFLTEDRKCDAMHVNNIGLTPLHHAAYFGHLELVRFYKEQLNLKFNSSNTVGLLRSAVESGNENLVQYLLEECDYKELDAIRIILNCAAQHKNVMLYMIAEKGYALSSVDASGNTLLHRAMDLESFKYLLQLTNFAFDKPNKYGITPLHMACIIGKLDILQYLVKKHSANLTVKDKDGKMPIHFAAQGCKVAVLVYLVKQGCDPHCADMNGNTPLHHTCSSDLPVNNITSNILLQLEIAKPGVHLRMVKMLVKNFSCNPNCVNYNKETPLHLACQYGYTDVVQYLVKDCQVDIFAEDNNKNSPLLVACQYGCVDIVKILIKKYREDHAHKKASLPIACIYGQCGVVKYLVENCKHDMMGKDSVGQTPLWYACKYQQEDVIDYLTNQLIIEGISTATLQQFEKEESEWISPHQVACKKGTFNLVKVLISRASVEQTKLIHNACIGGKIDVLQYLVENCGIEINSKDEDENTPLFKAVANGHLTVIEYLIKKGCDPLHKNIYGNTPMHFAVFHSQLSVLKYLREKLICDPSVTNNKDEMPFHYACKRGNIVIVQYLVEECAVDIDSKTKNGNTPFLTAVMNGHLAIIEYLIKHGCDILEQNIYGSGALHLAVFKNHLPVLKYLKEQLNCDPSVTSNEGDMPIHYACYEGNIDIVRYLVEECNIYINSQTKYGYTPFLFAVVRGHMPVIEYLIDQGCDIHTINVYGEQPAHLAIRSGDLSVVKYFKEQLKCDFSITYKTNDGHMPIHYACQRGNVGIVQYLVEECVVDINCKTKDGITPFHEAVMSGHLSVIKYLIKHGCDPLEPSVCGNGVIHLAVLNNQLSVLKYLKEHLNCDPSVINSKGETPIHSACQIGNIDIVRYLAEECSVDANSEDKEGNTPIILAAQEGHLAVVEYLITQGLDPLQKNSFGVIPADAAVVAGHLSVVKYLKERGYCNFYSANKQGLMAIHLACTKGKIDIVKYLVEECKVDIESVVKLDIASLVALPFDAEEKATQEFELLLSLLGSDSNFVLDTGVTPLLLAISNSHLTIIKYLIEQGCDPLCHDTKGNTPMHYAAQDSHLAIVKYLKENLNCDLDTTNSKGQMAIHLASAGGKIDVVQYLVEECSIDLMNEDKDDNSPFHAAAMPQDNEGNTPLHLAVRESQVEMVKFYMNNLINDLGLDPNTPNHNGATPLHLACQAGSLQMVKLFGECDICDFSVKDNNGRTLLHFVSWKSVDAVAIIMYLVRDKHCDPAISDNDGNTCLHLASQNGTLKVVQLLVCEFNCDPNCVNTQGKTPLQLASEDSVSDFFLHHSSKDEDHHVLSLLNLNILKLFANNCTDPEKVSQSPILRAIELDEPDQVNYYIVDKGFSIRATDTNGNTFLHIAALKGAIKVAKLLLNTFECDPNCENAQGATPLHLACAKGKKKIVDLLLNNNYNCQAFSKDKNGQTPLHYAVLQSELYIVEKLATQVCDFMIPDNTGHTPLHYAIHLKDVEILSYFLFEKECNLEVKGEDGNSYLHFAAKGGQLEIVHLICLMPDLNPCASNKYGCTPLDLATVYHNQEVVEFLQQHTTSTHSPPSVIHLSALLGHISSIQHYIADLQYDPDLRDSIGRTPLHYAAMGGHLIITQYLVSSSADPLSEDVFHNLPLHYAAALGHLDVVQFLVNIGSPLTARGVWDKTPAEMAAAGGDKNVLGYLNSLQDELD